MTDSAGTHAPDRPSVADAPVAPARVRLAFAALVVAMLPAVLDQTILATTLPTIASDLGRLADVAWVVTGYLVASTASTPLWGKLGDRHGHGRLLQIALVVFLAGSALCGAAQDLTQLIVFRAAQGLGAGGLMTLAMASVGALVPPRERGRYQGRIAAAFAGASVLGPLIGGLLVDHADWRWVFYVNLPLGALALLGLRRALPPDAPRRAPMGPLDLAGAVLLAAATTAGLLVCVWGGDRWGWGSPTVLGLIASCAALTAAFVARERRAPDPLVPLALLRSRVVAVASVTLFLTTASLFAIIVFVPLFLQATTGATPTEAGLLMLPMMAGTTLATTLSGRHMARTGRYKVFPVAGLGIMAVALAALAALTSARSAVATGAGLALFGLGFGMVSQVLVVAVQNGVERRQLGTATGVTTFFRALGGSAGAAVLGAAFTAKAGAPAQGGALGTLDAAARSDIAGAVGLVLLVGTALAVAALLAVLRLPEVELRSAADAPGDRARDVRAVRRPARPAPGPR
jgi:EmrB/QacA subfamily drug resistance transporter